MINYRRRGRTMAGRKAETSSSSPSSSAGWGQVVGEWKADRRPEIRSGLIVGARGQADEGDLNSSPEGPREVLTNWKLFRSPAQSCVSDGSPPAPTRRSWNWKVGQCFTVRLRNRSFAAAAGWECFAYSKWRHFFARLVCFRSPRNDQIWARASSDRLSGPSGGRSGASWRSQNKTLRASVKFS